jgi:hypothetical protein
MSIWKYLTLCVVLSILGVQYSNNNQPEALNLSKQAEASILNPINFSQSSFYKDFYGIQNKDDFWNFMRGPFSDAIFSKQVEGDTVDNWKVDIHNRGIGEIILRVIKVVPRQCLESHDIENTILLPVKRACYPEVE